MRNPITQNYYCIVSKKYLGEYELVIKRSTSGTKSQIKLKSRGYRVLTCLSKKSLLKIQNWSRNDFYILRSHWSEKAIDFIQSIDLLEEDK